MAKVTAINAEGQNVPVHQAQFNNRGEVESFLTSTPAGHQVWVHARDYTVTVDEEADQPDLTPGIMTKDTSLRANDTIKKDADELVPPADPAEPAVPSEPVVPPAPVTPTAPELPPADETVIDEGIISTGDLDGPKPTGPILDDIEPTLPPAEPAPTVPPAEPVTPPAPKPSTSTKPSRPAKK